MLEGFGHDIPESLDELLLQPCALVVWDMQEAIARKATNVASLIDNVRRLTESAREHGTPVIYSQHFSPPLEYEERSTIRALHRRSGGDLQSLKPAYPPASAGWQLMPETGPAVGDLVLAKSRRSFFLGTPLQDVLAAKRIDVLVLTGVSTDRGILTTARDAETRGFFVIVPEDAVGSFTAADHERGLRELRGIAEVCPTALILDAWRR